MKQNYRTIFVLAGLMLFAASAAAQDGQLDVTFNSTGIITTAGIGIGNSVAIQSDGKIVVAGYNAAIDFLVVRYTNAGMLDSTFSGDGKATTDFGTSNDFGQSVALQSDGKILVAGYTGSTFAIVRYNSDGTLDNTFDSDGKVTTAVVSGTNAAYSVAIQTDGKIVVAGSANANNGNGDDFAVVRYNSNGSLDSTFDSDGKVTTTIGTGTDFVNSVAIQSDGKIVVTGKAAVGFGAFATVRYSSNGALDSTFSNDGIVMTSIPPNHSITAHSVVVQADGKIVVAGTGASDGFVVVRYTNTGTLDNTFSGDGIVNTPATSVSATILSAVIQLDGRIVIAGYDSKSGTGFDVAVARYNSDGTLDNTFDSDGIVSTAVAASSGSDFGNSVVLQSDGKIVVAGVSGGNNLMIVRYTGSSGPLPVELISFTVQSKGNGVELTWNTVTEVNNYGFEVERKPLPIPPLTGEGIKEWGRVGFVEGSGTTNAPKEYSFSDNNLSAGKYSYRLKQIDRDGKFEYSPSVEVTINQAPKEFALEQNYPNPFNPSTVICYQLPLNGRVSLKVYDAIGREVAMLVNETKEMGSYSATFDASNLSSGIYFARLSSNGKSQLKKLLLIK